MGAIYCYRDLTATVCIIVVRNMKSCVGIFVLVFFIAIPCQSLHTIISSISQRTPRCINKSQLQVVSSFNRPQHGFLKKNMRLHGFSDWLLSYEDYGMTSMTDKFTIDNTFVPVVGLIVLSAITFALTRSKNISVDFPDNNRYNNNCE